MRRFFNVVRNKYLIAAAIFVVWMSFFDRYDFATQYSYQKEKSKLEHERAFYTSEISKITASIKDVKSDANVVQKIAREKYKMKKENEDVYIVTTVEAKEEE